MTDDFRIPAASIGKVDLDAVAARFPTEAREIARLDDLVQHGAETEEDMCRLCELLHQVGESTEAEYLLRRNIGCDKDQQVYRRLFGTAVPDHYARAIARFACVFGLELTLHEERGFLDGEYLSQPLDEETPRFNILDNPCVIRFEYSHRDFVIADVADAAANAAESVNYYDINTNVFFCWQHERWRLIDPRDASRY